MHLNLNVIRLLAHYLLIFFNHPLSTPTYPMPAFSLIIVLSFILAFILGLIAWLFSTVAAGGAATFVLPILGLLIGVEVAIPAVAMASVMSNPMRAFLFWPYIDWLVAKRLIAGSVLGACLGALGLASLPAHWIQIGLGLFLISTIFQLKRPFKFKPNHAPPQTASHPIPASSTRKKTPTVKLWHFFPIGSVVAFLSGLVGGTGPVLNPFLMNYGIKKEAIVATKAINSFVMQCVKLIAYGGLGLLSSQALAFGVSLGLGALLGTWLAKRQLLDLSDDRFKTYTTALMVCAGGVLMFKGIQALFA